MILEYGRNPIIRISLKTTLGEPIEGILYDDTDLEVILTPIGSTSQTLTLTQGSVGVYIPNGWIEIPGDPGRYELCLPTVQPDTRYEIKTTYATNLPQRGYVDVVELDRGTSLPLDEDGSLYEVAESSQSYGPRRVKTKELEVEQFDPKMIQQVKERQSLKTKQINFGTLGGIYVKPKGDCGCG